MKIEDFLDSHKDYYSIETFIISLLKIHVEAQGKPFQIINNTLGDAIAEDGFDDFSGGTLIEIKPTLSPRRINVLIDKFLQLRIKSPNGKEIKNLVLISPIWTILNEDKTTKHLITGHDHSGLQISLWGTEKINNVIYQHRKDANIIANNIFEKRLENAINVTSKDWKEERQERLDELRELYTKGQFSMFLGAGVSSSAGMADWNTLLNSLFVSYLSNEFQSDKKIEETDIKEIVLRLNQVDETSALRAARYLRKALIKNPKIDSNFITAITENLYKLRDTTKQLDSALIQSISNLCMPTRTGAKVKSVVTYNFDDLLERNLKEKKIRHHSIYMDNDFCDPEDLPIYHVHGFLPEDRKKYPNLENSTLVFSEEGYHTIYTDAYHWSNLVQLSNLRDNNCLMIGLSMADPNLRRLLDISAKNLDKPRHFAIIRRISHNSFCYDKKDGEDKVQMVQNLEAAKNFLEDHHKLNEDLMRELGITVIWYEAHEDIPELLDELKS